MTESHGRKRRQLLKALHTFRRPARLGASPLARQLELVALCREQNSFPDTPVGWGTAFQQVLREAHQRMCPGGERDDQSLAWRRYSLIDLKFFQSLPTLQVCDRLGLAPEITSTFYHWQTQALSELLERLEELTAQRCQRARGTPFQAPPPLPTYVSRPEIERPLRQFLAAEQVPGEVTTVGLYGIGGVGKSVLATQVTRELRDQFPDGVLWVEVADRDPLIILGDLARSYGRDVSNYPDLEGRSAAVRSILSQKRALLVLDDVQEERISALPYLLPPPNCRAIVTSRLRHLPGIPAGAMWRVDGFTTGQALQLLGQVLGQERVATQTAGAVSIAEQVGHLPLALDIVARRLAEEPERRLDEYAALLAGEHHQLTELDVGPDKALNVRISLQSSYYALPPGDQCRFRRLGALAAPTFGAEAVSALAEEALEETNVGLKQLIQRSLVQQAGESRYRLHPLLRRYALEQLHATGEYAIARRLHADYCFSLARLNHVPDRYRVLDEELENLVAAITWEYDQAQWSRVVRFVTFLADYWEARGYWGHAERCLQMAIQASHNLADATTEAELLNKLGIVKWNLGQLDDAFEVHERAIAVATQAEHQGQAAYGRFLRGNVLLVKGDLKRAREHYRQAITEARPEDTLLAARAWNNLGEVYRIQGEWDQAPHCYERCLEVLQLVSAEESLAAKAIAAKAYGNMGIIFRRQGQFETALEYYRKDLELKEQLGDIPGRARTLVNLGNAYSDMGDLQAALEAHRSAAQVFQQIGDLRTLLSVYNNLGDLYQELGSLDRALGFYEQAVGCGKQVGTPLNLGESYVGLATCYLDLGDHDQASACCAMAEEVYRRLNSVKEMAFIWKLRGDICRAKGELATAWEWLHRALQATRESGQVQNESEVCESIGRLHEAQGDLDQAVLSYKASVEIREVSGYRWGYARAQALLRQAQERLREACRED